MAKLIPWNDHLLVEIENKYGKFGKPEDEGYESGTVISVSKHMPYFGSHNWTFESSLGDESRLAKLREFYQELVGKKVYWEEYADRGVTIEEGGKTYALIKMTKIIAVEEE